MEKKADDFILRTPISKIDDAGGVPENERFWFVAIVNNKSEQKYANLIQRFGLETFLPVQKQKKIGEDGHIKETNKVLLAATIFVHCTQNERLTILKYGFVKRFMVDKTRINKLGKHPVAIIPNFQIDTFRRFIEVEDSPIELLPVPYEVGDLVKVISGKFQGLVGQVVRYSEEKAYLVICLGLLGCANLKIDAKLVAKV